MICCTKFRSDFDAWCYVCNHVMIWKNFLSVCDVYICRIWYFWKHLWTLLNWTQTRDHLLKVSHKLNFYLHFADLTNLNTDPTLTPTPTPMRTHTLTPTLIPALTPIQTSTPQTPTVTPPTPTPTPTPPTPTSKHVCMWVYCGGSQNLMVRWCVCKRVLVGTCACVFVCWFACVNTCRRWHVVPVSARAVMFMCVCACACVCACVCVQILVRMCVLVWVSVSVSVSAYCTTIIIFSKSTFNICWVCSYLKQIYGSLHISRNRFWTPRTTDRRTKWSAACTNSNTDTNIDTDTDTWLRYQHQRRHQH